MYVLDIENGTNVDQNKIPVKLLCTSRSISKYRVNIIYKFYRHK